MAPPPLSWGILGTGRIALTFAKAIATSRTGRLAAVASRQQAVADEFVKNFSPARAYGSYEELLGDPEVQAVYISTPHPFHAEWTIRAARAGKHILCEKPIGLNHAEAMAAAEAARQHGVFLMEAFMYRCHPQTAKVVEIVRSGRLGEIRLIRASFAFRSDYKAESRLHRQDLGGGGILDVGCYCMSMARLVAGAAQGRAFAEPVHIRALGKLGELSRVDEQAVAILSFESGILAQLSTGINATQDNTVTVYGSSGSLHIPSPWFAGNVCRLELTTGEEKQIIEIEAEAPLYSIEIDTVAASLKDGQAACLPIDDTLGNMAALDRWRTEIGLFYDNEKGTAPRPALPPLRRASAIAGAHGFIPGIDKPISRMVLGTMLEGATIAPPHATVLCDYFLEHGGTCFDTAHVYGGGSGERFLGEWMRQRGVREDIVLIAKGAHTPHCNPEGMRAELQESLERLQTDYADIYMLHRDNPEVPVGEFVEALDEQVRAGRIRLFGGSNWSIERVAAANEYARKKGLRGFSVLSNQFSLARMVNPVWAGCITSSDPASKQWLIENQMPLFAWSSQARGFFVRGARTFTSDPELVRTWYCDDNFERLPRVQELARKKGVEPVHIAAAYVLHQPFPVFALIGPRKLSELSSSFQAFSVVLSPEEMAWLNLETN